MRRRVRSTDPSKHEYKLTFQPAANLTVRRGQQPILEFAVYWTAGGPPAPANALPRAAAAPAPPQRPPVRPAQVRLGGRRPAARAAVAARSPQGAATTPGAETGTLQLRKSAANLRAADLSLVKAATSDPYCRCSFGGSSARAPSRRTARPSGRRPSTSRRRAARPPVARPAPARPALHPSLTLPPPSQVSVRELGTTPLRLVVWDEDKGRLRELGSSKDDVLGEITLMLDIARLRSTDKSRHNYHINCGPRHNKGQGTLDCRVVEVGRAAEAAAAARAAAAAEGAAAGGELAAAAHGRIAERTAHPPP